MSSFDVISDAELYYWDESADMNRSTISSVNTDDLYVQTPLEEDLQGLNETTCISVEDTTLSGLDSSTSDSSSTCVHVSQIASNIMELSDSSSSNSREEFLTGIIIIRPKESIMLSDRFMLFAPIELKFFFSPFHASLITK